MSMSLSTRTAVSGDMRELLGMHEKFADWLKGRAALKSD